jgi:hypothetical protein
MLILALAMREKTGSRKPVTTSPEELRSLRFSRARTANSQYTPA